MFRVTKKILIGEVHVLILMWILGLGSSKNSPPPMVDDSKWNEKTPINVNEFLEDINADEVDNYIFPNITSDREANLILNTLHKNQYLPVKFFWPQALKSNSFRSSLIWSGREYEGLGKPGLCISDKGVSSWLLFLWFLVFFMIAVILFMICIKPVGFALFHVCYFIYWLFTNPCVRRSGRYLLIRWQIFKRKIEVARSPDVSHLLPYTLPKFFRKNPDDDYPIELQENDKKIELEHRKAPSEIKVSDRYGNYMENIGFEYDPVTKRFIANAALKAPTKEATATRKRLREARIQQARELLARDRENIYTIPGYRKLALELNIPYAEDRDRRVVLEAVSGGARRLRPTYSALDPTPRVIKPKQKKSTRSKQQEPPLEGDKKQEAQSAPKAETLDVEI